MKNITTQQKVLLVITKSNFGGAQKYVFDLAYGLSQDENFSVKVLVGGNGELIHKLKEKNIEVINIPNIIRDVSLLRDLKSFLWLVKTFRREHPDVVHLNSSKIGLFGALAGRLSGIKKIVFTAHGWPFTEDRPQWQKIIFRYLALLTVLLSHTTIGVSKTTIEKLKAPKFLQKKIKQIYLGIKNINYHTRDTFFTERNLELPTGVRIVSVGELHKNKGYDIAISYLEKIKNLDWSYHILGGGDKAKDLQKEINEKGLSNKVFLYGHIKDASHYLTSFDLFLLPSRTEALGYVVLEAVNASLPIVAHHVGSVPEILIDDPYSVLITPNNIDDAKKVLEEMINNLPQVLTSHREHIHLKFTQDEMIRKTKEIYVE